MTGFKGIERNWILKALVVVLSCFLKIKIAKQPTEDIIPRGNMLLYINCNTKPQMIVKLRKTMLKEGDEQSHLKMEAPNSPTVDDGATFSSCYR